MTKKKQIGISDRDIAERLRKTEFKEKTHNVSEIMPRKEPQKRDNTIRISGKSLMVY